MYIRKDTRRTAGSGDRVYLSLAHNVRERLSDGTTRSKPVTFARLGREEDLDKEMVEQMRNAFDRYLQKRFGKDPPSSEDIVEAAGEVEDRTPGLRLLASRAYGMRVVVEHVWKKLGLDRALVEVEKAHKMTYPFERIVFAMVLNRLTDLTSKRACNEWARNEAWLPELEHVEVQHFYRALDVLTAHTDEVLAAEGKAAHEACPDDELPTLLIDTTSSYMESDYDDRERKQIAEEWMAYTRGEADKPDFPPPQVVNDPPLRMRGHSKDNHPREPQVKIGLVSTLTGQVVDLQVCAGHMNDQRLTVTLVKAAQDRLPGTSLIAVMDSGMGGTPNCKAIDDLQPPVHRVSAVPLRRSKFAEETLLARPGRWARHPYRTGFTYRDVVLSAEDSPSGRAERWVATRNSAEASKQRRLLEKEVARVQAALDQDCRVDDHGQPVCKLLANPKRRRLLRLSAKGDRYLLDRERVRLERRRAGVHVVRSTLVDQPVEVTLRAYHAQYGVEAQFRALKSPLRLRPMHHRADRRIRGHVLMCGLALMMLRELERRTERSFQDVQKAVGRVRAVQVQQGRTVFWQREQWTEEAKSVLEAVGAAPGPVMWGAHRVEAPS